MFCYWRHCNVFILIVVLGKSVCMHVFAYGMNGMPIDKSHVSFFPRLLLVLYHLFVSYTDFILIHNWPCLCSFLACNLSLHSHPTMKLIWFNTKLFCADWNMHFDNTITFPQNCTFLSMVMKAYKYFRGFETRGYWFKSIASDFSSFLH